LSGRLAQSPKSRTVREGMPLYFRENRQKSIFCGRLCCLSMIYDSVISFSIKSHRRCYTRLWRPKPRQAESA
jgi:hypothetical protein